MIVYRSLPLCNLYRGSAKRASYIKTAYMQLVHRIPSPFQKQLEGVPSTILTHARLPFQLYSAAASASDAAKLGLYEPLYTPTIPVDLITDTIYGNDYLFAEEMNQVDDQEAVNEGRTAGILNALQYRLMRGSSMCRVTE